MNLGTRNLTTNGEKCLDPVVRKFKEIIQNLAIPVHSIYLFGSRANGNSKKDSDYDFLILLEDVSDKEILKEMKSKIIISVHEEILNTDFDILIRNRSVFENNKNVMNTLYNTVYEEGILIYRCDEKLSI